MRKLYLSILVLSVFGINAFGQDPTIQAPTPINNSSDVVSIFSDAAGYGSNRITTPAVNSIRATATYVAVNSDNVLQLSYKLDNNTTSGGDPIVTNYSQTEFTTVNASSYNYFHIDIYNPASGGTSLATLTIKLVDYGPDDSRTSNADNKEGQVTINTPAPGTWSSYNLQISDFKVGSTTPLVTQRANIGGLLITASENSNLYLDNIYFSTVSTLPLKLTSFTGKLNTEGVKLNWTSEAETNFKGYVIERSTDNSSFTAIPGVFIESGKNSYSYIDKTFGTGNNYYRLKMVDNDGTITYSDVINVKSDLTATVSQEVKLYPNPIGNELTISYASDERGESNISIYDAQGKLVKSHKATIAVGDNTTKINTADLNSGIYFLQVINNGKSISRQTVIK